MPLFYKALKRKFYFPLTEEEEKEPENKEDVQNGAISSFRLPR